jgi:hypothetical protein
VTTHPTLLAVPASISGVELEVTCFASATEHVCRIGYAGKRGSGNVDAYYPYADVGMLSFRREGELWCASGMLKQKVFSSEAAVDALLEFLGSAVGYGDEQLAVCIELVSATRCLIRSGEECLSFEGDGEESARFARPRTRAEV